jgi:hypothetical protein
VCKQIIAHIIGGKEEKRTADTVHITDECAED